MAKGISIHVGVNQVESKTFEAEPLKGCEEDARSMFEIAKGLGFVPGRSDSGKESPLLGKDATLDNVVTAISRAARDLKRGDIFLFTFAGHGIQSLDPDAEGDSDDLLDESIVLVDHMLLDNYWKSDLWPKFKAGVRAVAVADCCHSETVFLATIPEQDSDFGAMSAVGGFGGGDRLSEPHAFSDVRRIDPVAEPSVAVRRVLEAELEKELSAFPEVYDEQRKTPSKTIKARRLLLSACKDGELADDGQPHGAFTQALLNVWNDGKFDGDYTELMREISDQFALTKQHPVLTPNVKSEFSRQRAFSIGINR